MEADSKSFLVIAIKLILYVELNFSCLILHVAIDGKTRYVNPRMILKIISEYLIIELFNEVRRLPSLLKLKIIDHLRVWMSYKFSYSVVEYVHTCKTFSSADQVIINLHNVCLVSDFLELSEYVCSTCLASVKSQSTVIY